MGRITINMDLHVGCVLIIYTTNVQAGFHTGFLVTAEGVLDDMSCFNKAIQGYKSSETATF